MHYTVTETTKSDYRIKGSKFISLIAYAGALSDVEKFLDSVRNEHPTATHHCYAYHLNAENPIEFANDDGEPGGTAGLPILNTVKSAGLTNIVAAVVRYYGGSKLGKSGLIDAYSRATQLAIKSSHLKKLIPIKRYRIGYRYENQSLIDKLKNDFPIVELFANYTDSVDMELGIPIDVAEDVLYRLNSMKHLLLDLVELGSGFHIQKN